MTIDIDLSREACDRRLFESLLELTEHPDRWDQSTWGQTNLNPDEFRSQARQGEWPCGTVACLAGRACLRNGFVDADFDPDEGDEASWLTINHAGKLLMRQQSVHTEMTPEDDDFRGVARILFGLSDEQARNLFGSENSLFKLWMLASAYTEGRVHLPDELVSEVHRIDASLKAVV